MKLPRDLSGPALARALEVLGYTVSRQTGSHLRLTTQTHGEHHLTIPNHASLRVGTLSAICLPWLGISRRPATRSRNNCSPNNRRVLGCAALGHRARGLGSRRAVRRFPTRPDACGGRVHPEPQRHRRSRRRDGCREPAEGKDAEPRRFRRGSAAGCEVRMFVIK